MPVPGSNAPGGVGTSTWSLGPYADIVIGPATLTVVLTVLGWVTAGAAGAVVGLALAALVSVSVVVAAAVWARGPGSLIHPDDVRAVAPRPPGFASLCDWVYDRTLD